MLDVAFVLLIAFMIVAPSLKYGYKIDLPQDANPPLIDQKDETENKPAVISLPRPGPDGVYRYMLNEDQVTLDELQSRLADMRAVNDKLVVEIQADKTVPYEYIIRAVGASRRAGIEGFSLPIEEDSMGEVTAPVPAAPVATPAVTPVADMSIPPLPAPDSKTTKK